MSDPADPADTLSRLQTAVAVALRDHTDILDPLGKVCRACTELLPVAGASISVMSGTEHRETLYASDPVIDRIEALQFTLAEGPCFEAFTTGRPVLVADLAADSATAWPVFAAQMADEPVGAIFAFPLQLGAARIGAIDMYRHTPGPLAPDALATALQLTDIAATALAGLPLTADGEELDYAWFSALPRNREQVNQAIGMLISAHTIPADQALARLRGYAFATGRLVDDVAADLVARRLPPEEIAV